MGLLLLYGRLRVGRKLPSIPWHFWMNMVLRQCQARHPLSSNWVVHFVESCPRTERQILYLYKAILDCVETDPLRAFIKPRGERRDLIYGLYRWAWASLNNFYGPGHGQGYVVLVSGTDMPIASYVAPTNTSIKTPAEL